MGPDSFPAGLRGLGVRERVLKNSGPLGIGPIALVHYVPWFFTPLLGSTKEIDRRVRALELASRHVVHSIHL